MGGGVGNRRPGSYIYIYICTLPETNSWLLKMGHPNKKKIVFQPSIFRCKLARFVSGSRVKKSNTLGFMKLTHAVLIPGDSRMD